MKTWFAHSMPFGAQPLAGGGIRFRLWAPAQRQVDLLLSDLDLALPMHAVSDGWFELESELARPGSRYCYRLDDGQTVPDPASRLQAADVHDASVVVDPRDFEWRHGEWRGRPWEDTVLYELHVGTFTGDGSFDGVRRRLDHLADLGITAVELMPLADFPGSRNWGYDGVLPFAPDRSYGTPSDLKRLIDHAHGLGLMMFLDVVYNHFGPEGNYLHALAPAFFTDRHTTPWGAAIDFARSEVRDFFVHNALYWLGEYRFDGLRFDAVHAILDDSNPHFLNELALRVRQAFDPGRQVHLVLENDANEARYLGGQTAGRFDAQWNDDFHHVCHAIATGEAGGYYADYADAAVERLGRALAEGFVYQGDASAYRDGERRGEPSAGLPPSAFVNFLQNHDQIGNRAFGERLTVLSEPAPRRALTAILLLAPSIPMLFMGEEWDAEEPFTFFCDFHDELAEAVREGRRREFAGFPQFSDPAARARIPDPNAAATYATSRLDWSTLGGERQQAWLGYNRELLRLRSEVIVPRLAGMTGGAGFRTWDGGGLAVDWTLGDGRPYALLANLGPTPLAGCPAPAGELVFACGDQAWQAVQVGRLPPWSAVFTLGPAGGERR